jgi:hypothetical protein
MEEEIYLCPVSVHCRDFRTITVVRILNSLHKWK